MNELLSVNYLNSVSRSLSLLEQSRPFDHFESSVKFNYAYEVLNGVCYLESCPKFNFVHEILNGICHPISNTFYQIIRPENLQDLYDGVKVIDKKVPTYQDYKNASVHIEKNTQKEPLQDECTSFLKLETKGTAGQGMEKPLVDGSNISLIRCLNPKTIRKFMLAFNGALNLVSQIVNLGLTNVDQIEKQFRNFFNTLDIGNQYRQKGVLVSQIDLSSRSQLVAEFKKREFTPEMINKSYRLAAQAYEESVRLYGHDRQPQFSAEYKLLMQDIIYFPPKFTELPLLMKNFLKSFVDRLFEVSRLGVTDHNSIIVLAAWAHRELVKLHPFGDGNGRMARIFMNAILKFFDIDPIVFLNNKEYIEAIKKETKMPGAFANYLIQIAIPEMENNPGLLSWNSQESIFKRVREALIANQADNQSVKS